MAGKSTYLAEALLNHILRGVTWPSPSAVYVGLFTEAPTSTSDGVEVSADDYERVQITFAAPSDRTVLSSGTASFGIPVESWGTIRAVGIFDALVDGHLLIWSSCAVNAIGGGSLVQIFEGDISIAEV